MREEIIYAWYLGVVREQDTNITLSFGKKKLAAVINPEASIWKFSTDGVLVSYGMHNKNIVILIDWADDKT